MQTYVKYIVFLLICILSRVVSAIYYIEDPDSLRFALSVFDQFDLLSMQPHFPGYPVFCFMAKIFYVIFGNFSIVFSIIGGIAVFLIIIFVLKLLKLPLLSLEGVLTAILLFFNPMIWIMSNKYMPDLIGVGALIAAFSYLVPDTYKNKDLFKGWFLTGILIGLNPSYLPFLFIPCIYALITKKKYVQSMFFLLLGILFWMVPVIMDTGWANLIQMAQSQSISNIYHFGEKVLSENDYGLRFTRLIQSIWADGLGGYWTDRNPALILTSLGMIACLFFGFLILLSFGYERSKVAVIIGSILLYTCWVYFFQDIVYHSWHVLPLIPFLLILVSYGIIYFLVNYNFLFVKVLTLLFLLGNVFITVILAVQHTSPTAIAQVKEYVVRNKQTDEEVTIVSIPLVNQFLSSQNVSARYISIPQDSVEHYLSIVNKVKSGKMVVIGNLSSLVRQKPSTIVRFQHNPYVNRVWPDIYVHEYYLKK